MRIDVITIFPEFFSGLLGASLLGKAIERGDVDVRLHQLRDWTTDRHRTVDDAPYGGGRGMVMKIEPLVAAIEAVAAPGATRILLAARGRRFTQARAAELAGGARQLVLVCGRYEGVDERIAGWIDDQLCIGDYVLSGGEPAAAVVIDAVVRLLPGVVGNRESLVEESFADGLLEYPQYTRPEVFRGLRVPEVLRSGNHAEVERWRREAAAATTRAMRPDLLAGCDGIATGHPVPTRGATDEPKVPSPGGREPGTVGPDARRVSAGQDGATGEAAAGPPGPGRRR